MSHAILVNSSSPSVSDYFDNIYLVNLEHETENRFKVAHHLRAHGIRFELFAAVNGYQGEAYAKWQEYSARPLGALRRFPEFNEKEKSRGKHFIESAGAIGYIHTYIAILKDARRRNFKRILILEDDVILANDFGEAFQRFLTSVGDDWKVLQLGASQYKWGDVDLDAAKANGYYYPRSLATCGSFAIAFDHSVFDELIEIESSFEAPFDHITLGELYERHFGKCYVAYPNIVMPDVGTSTIRGARNQFEHGKRMKWDVTNFNYPLNKFSVGLLVRHPAQARNLLEAVKRNELPVTLAVLGVSPDGVRPIHNAELTTVEDWQGALPEDALGELSAYDCYAYTASTADVEISDIVRLVESRLALSSSDSGPLIPFQPRARALVAGRVSTIIPSYKRPENLLRALTSVAGQSWADKEVIVVSDNGEGSPYNEETRAVVEKVRRKYPDVVIHYVEHSVNRNGAAARNTGLQYASGEFVTFLDDDDEYLGGRLEKSVRKLQVLPKAVGAVYCGFLGWNSPANNESRYPKGNVSEHILTLDYKKHYLHTNTATYRRPYLDMINGFDESYPRHQDLEFNLRYMAVSGFETVPECLVRLNPQPSTVSNKVYGTRFLAIKQKFLNEFAWLIDRFEAPLRNRIYHTHWDEVYRYVADRDEVLSALRGQVTNGELQLFLRLTGEA
ncbi:glycosyltransferase involved in cell wall biosynthesis [Marinimicrobium koreense]|uniref:Glycosyltransferase involved in cell wall biosynthesis n=1 Tax=Marinimicrobium koreense TaxID=306545 RepID=A0A3N1NJR7_9GAMM|nr:glycosyltransferase [Marinimicrobium koreense]ROQ20054.1 glycosyltransferase involved in cell wall biosynthesis [Marinimicrobium koreense]